MPGTSNTEQIKARLEEGAEVSFRAGRENKRGRVEKMNPKRAKIVVSQTGKTEVWNVPYPLLRIANTQTDYAQLEAAALNRARELLRTHNLPDWQAELDDAGQRAGCCDYKRRCIRISRLYARKVTPAELDDTILHEIAHALAGRHAHHGKIWKAIAHKIGCSGRVCHNQQFSRPTWLAYCKNTCFTPTPRRKRGTYKCKTCGEKIFYKRALVGELASD